MLKTLEGKCRCFWQKGHCTNGLCTISLGIPSPAVSLFFSPLPMPCSLYFPHASIVVNCHDEMWLCGSGWLSPKCSSLTFPNRLIGLLCVLQAKKDFFPKIDPLSCYAICIFPLYKPKTKAPTHAYLCKWSSEIIHRIRHKFLFIVLGLETRIRRTKY